MEHILEFLAIQFRNCDRPAVVTVNSIPKLLCPLIVLFFRQDPVLSMAQWDIAQSLWARAVSEGRDAGH